MTTVRLAFRVVWETVVELRLDVLEVLEFVSELVGLDSVWSRMLGTLENIRLTCTPRGGCKRAGRGRSLIRMIGSRLPLKPQKRVYLRVVEIAKMGAENQESKDVLPVGLQGLTNDMFPSTIDTQIKHRWLVPVSAFQFADFGTSLASPCPFPGNIAACTSTPKQIIGSWATLVPSGAARVDLNRMVDLESELERLQSQIATVIAMKAARQSTASPCKRRCGLPPPPPPPLPSRPLFVPQSATSSSRPKPEVLECALSSNVRSAKSNSLCCPSLRVNLTEILKDIANVKLRKIDRSPGGTPIRTVAKLPSENDPGAIMAAALKRRFAHLQSLQESYEKENVETEKAWDSSSSFASPEKTDTTMPNGLRCNSVAVA